MSEPIPQVQMERVPNPVYPEESRSFDENQMIFTAKHADEVFPPQLAGDHIAIVFKASQELYNGNLGKQLLALAEQTVPTEKYEAVIVVNNLRMYADMGEEYLQQHDTGAEQIALTFDKSRAREDISPAEVETYKAVSTNSEAAEHAIASYFENKRTLQVLQTITTATTQLLETQDEKQEQAIIASALAEIASFFGPRMDEPTKTLVLTGARKAMEKRVRIYGLDCSTGDKGYRHKSLLQPTNEGAHIAYARGAAYIDFRDMDEFPESPNNLEELVNLLALPPESQPDVVFRAMDMMVAHHPEELPDSNSILETIAQDYVIAISNAMYYANINTQFHIGVGRLVVGKDLFRKRQYSSPQGFDDDNEDYAASRIYQEDMQRGIRLVDPASRLRLDSSAKVSSVSSDSKRLLKDISDMTKARNVDDFGNYIQKNIRYSLATGHEVESRLAAIVAESPENDLARKLLDTYRSIRSEYFTIQQTERKKMRAILFGDLDSGSEGILPSVLPKLDTNTVLSASPEQMKHMLEDLLPQLQLPQDVQLYLVKNPMLIKGIVQASQKYGLDSQEKIQAFLEEKALPELLAPPLVSEPDYSAIPQMLTTDMVFNLTDWMHVFQANQYLAAYLTNMQVESSIPDALAQIISIVKKNFK